MNSRASNRDNPQFVAYYQALADILGIFWQFHKRRIQEGNIAFAYSTNRKRTLYREFNVDELMQESHPRDIIADFSTAVTQSLIGSFSQFLGIAGIDHVPSFLDTLSLQPSDEINAIIPQEHTRQLIVKAQELGKQLGTPDERYIRSSVELVATLGINTANPIATQLAALFQHLFFPTDVLVASKIEMDNIRALREGIGLKPDHISYHAVDIETSRLRRDVLKQFGLGETIGCPAGLKISKITRGILEDSGISIGVTMLEEFAEMMKSQFELSIGSWFHGLTPIQKQIFLSPETRKVLEGTTGYTPQRERE